MSRHNALVVFAAVSLSACSNATDVDPAPTDEPVLRTAGEPWGTAPAASASGQWLRPETVLLERGPHPLRLQWHQSQQGPYLPESSPAASGLLTLVNTASATVLDEQVGESEQPVVGTILDGRPFDTVAGLDELPGVDRPVLDNLLQHALLDGYVAGFDDRELIFDIASQAAANGGELDQSFGDHVVPLSAGEAERELGSLPGQLVARFLATQGTGDLQVTTSTHAIEAYGVPVGWIVAVVTDDPDTARFGTQYFVSGDAERDILVEADVVSQ